MIQRGQVDVRAARGGRRTLRPVRIPAHGLTLEGDLTIPSEPCGLVLFAHGSGSSRKSTRNRAVAEALNDAGLATLLFDLLTLDEEAFPQAQFRFDIDLLAHRLVAAVDWAATLPDLRVPIGLFGASTGAAAALVAAAERPQLVRAVVSRGGRPDLAGEALEHVKAPTLLLVGGRDPEVLELNRRAQRRLPGESVLEIVPGATHLFEEPGALAEVARRARDWFAIRLGF